MHSSRLHSRATAAAAADLVSDTASSSPKRPRSPVLRVRRPMANYGIGFVPASIAVHVLGLVILGLVLTWLTVFRTGVNLFSSDANKIFNAHPVLMFGGFIFIYSEAILVYKIFGGSKKTKKLIHLSLQGIAFLLALVGVYAAYKNHVMGGVDNFYSLHSWLGIATLSLFFIQWMFGFFAFWTQSVGPSTRASAVPWHVFLGLAIYGLAIGTAVAGLLEKITFLNTSSGVGHYAGETLFVNATGLVVVLFGVVTIFAALYPSREDDGYIPIH